MLEKSNTSLQNYINNSYSVEVKPRVFLEINGNDYGQPYFMGTETRPSGSPSDIYNYIKRSLTARPGSASPVTSEQTISTALKDSEPAVELNCNSGDNSWFSYSTIGHKTVKFNLFLKAEVSSSGEFNYQNSFDVTISAIGVDANNKAVRSEVVTKTVFVDDITWEPTTIAFANPDDADINRVRLDISVHIEPGKRGKLLVGQLTCAQVSAYEVFVENRLPLETVFKGQRPGEFLLEMPQSARPREVMGNQTVHQQCTSVHMPMSFALGKKYEKVQRSVIPYKDNPFVYYTSGSDLSSKRIWAFYKNKIKSNKIILKFNTLVSMPLIYTIEILTSSGWVSINSPSIDSNGIVSLYYKSGSWSTTKWTDSEYPKISQSGSNAGKIVSTVSGVDQIAELEVYGIALNIGSMSIVNSDFSGIGSSATRLELIELSPRLEVDLSDLVMSTSIIKETDSENEFLNIGGISSNSMTVKLSNILITKENNDSLSGSENNDVRPISNISATSPLYKILTRGAKIRAGFDIMSSTKTYVPSFTGYLDKWSESDNDISLQGFDVVKYLQSTTVAPLYLKGTPIVDCIVAILDSCGMSDVYFQDLYNLKFLSQRADAIGSLNPDERIPYFWTDKDKSVTEVLNDLFKVYQIAMYADEYGGLKIDSLYNYNLIYSQLTGSSPSKTPDLYVQDADDSSKNIKSNLVSVEIEENEIPKKILVKYKTPRPSMSIPVSRRKKTEDEKMDEKNKQKSSDGEKFFITKPATNVAWEFQEENYPLPFIRIKHPGITSISQNYIPYLSDKLSILTTVPYSSHLLIDDEIVSYEGVQYEIKYKTSSSQQTWSSITRRVNSPEEIDGIVDELLRNGAVIVQNAEPTGKLLNVKRGLFGTAPAIHTNISSNSDIKWSAKKFTKSNSSYANVEPGSSHIVKTTSGIKVNVNNNDKLIYLIPENTEDDSEIMNNKTKLSFQFKLEELKKNDEGYFGAALGTKIDSGKLTSGLLVFVGVEQNKNKTNPIVWVEQIVNGGTIKQIISKDEFQYSEPLLDEDENVEVYVSLNKARNQCTILVGGTSVFKKTEKDGNNKKKKKIVTSFKLNEPLPKKSSFGFIGKGNGGSAILGQFLFGNTNKPEDLSDIEIDDVDDTYSKPRGSSPDATYFIGNDSLLDNIVQYQLISGNFDSPKDNFAWFATPVGRGIKVFEVDYEAFPVTSIPEVKYLGYSYIIESFQTANIFSGSSDG